MSTTTSDNSDFLSGLPEPPPSGQLLIPVGRGELSPSTGWPAAATPGADALTAGPRLTQLLHAFRRRWPLAVGLGLMLGGLFAALVWLVVPVSYEASAMLRVQRTVEGGAGLDPDSYNIMRKSQAQLVKSGLVLQEVLKDDSIRNLQMVRAEEQPLGWLEKALKVDYLGDSELMMVALRGRESRELPIIVNMVKHVYLKEIVDKDRNEKQDRRGHIAEQLNAKRSALADKWRAYNNLVDSSGTKDSKQAETERALLITYLNGLSNKMSEAVSMQLRNDLDTQAMEAKIARKPQVADVPESMVDKAVNEDPDVRIAQQKQTEARDKQAQIEAVDRRRKQAPEWIELQRRIESLQQTIDDRKVELRPALQKQLLTAIQQSRGPLPDQTPEENMNLLKAQRVLIDSSLKKLTAEYESKSERAKTLGVSSAGFEALRSELDTLEQLTRKLQQDLDSIDIELSIASPRVISVEDAREPEGSNAIYRYLLVAFGGIIGFGMAASSVVFAEFQARRVNNTGEVNNDLGLRVLGVLPSRGRRGANNNEAVTESIDSIRTMLLKGGGPDAPHMVLVTSAVEREGKTTVASQLAASLARSGRRTLIVDGDLRKPGLHGLFGLPLENGLCEVLRREIDTDDALHPTMIDGLSLMTAGVCDVTAIMALSRDGVQEVFRRLRAKYDFVVLDSGPVLAYADSLLLGHFADAAVLSVRRDVSQSPKVYAARERLEAVGVRVLGAVVNGVSVAMRNLSSRK